MTKLLRSPKPWPYVVAVLLVVLAVIGLYLYQRHRRIKALVEDLRSGEAEVARTAAGSLGEMGPEIVHYLTPKLKDMNSQSRVYAAAALRDSGSAVPSLVEGLKDKDAGVRAAAAEVLGKMGPAASESVPDLIAALDDEDAEVRETAKAALGGMKDPRAVRPLIESFRRKPPSGGGAPDAAEEALLKIGPDALPELTAALGSAGPRVKVACAIVLGRMGPAAQGAVPTLVGALKDEDADVSRTAVRALGEIKDPRAVNPLIETFYRDLSSDNPAPAALGKIGGEAIPALVEKLGGDIAEIRGFSAAALGEAGPPARLAVQPLIARLKDPAVAVRRKAVWALGRIKDKEAVPHLLALLKRTPSDAGVVEALGEIGPDAGEATPLLKNMFWDEGLHTVVAAAWKKINPESMDYIIYLEKRYAYLEDAVSVELLKPTTEEIVLGGDNNPVAVVVRFQWELEDRKEDVVFCSTLTLDKGDNPYDGGVGLTFRPGRATSYKARLNYGEYHLAPFEWGVTVIACQDSGASCDRRGWCLGRIFKGDVGEYVVED